MRLKRWTLLLLSLLLVLLVACDAEEDPVEVIRSFMAAVEAFDVTKAQHLVCQAQRARVQDSLEPFGALTEADEAFAIRFDDLTFQERSNDGKVAIVHVRGQLIVSFLGQQEVQEVDEEHVLVKEGGRWLVCDP
jgi:hypothetical protein